MAGNHLHMLILQHLAHEDAGNIYTWASDNHCIVTTLLVPEHEGELPSLHSFDILVILGGTMGVYEEDNYPWMKKERAFIQQAIDADKWVIGICLGAQLLAATLGSKVYPHQQKEIGFYPVYKTTAGKEEDALQHVPDAWTVFHWHGDTFDIPAGAQHLFYSEACTNQAFRKGKCWGLQFHPEVNAMLLDNMIMGEEDELKKGTYVQTAGEINEAFMEHNHAACFHAIVNNIIKE
jgi:GMP synthase-like glutamine amidotransferase